MRGLAYLLTCSELSCVRLAKYESTAGAQGHNGGRVEGGKMVLVNHRIVLGGHIFGMDDILTKKKKALGCAGGMRRCGRPAEGRAAHLDPTHTP